MQTTRTNPESVSQIKEGVKDLQGKMKNLGINQMVIIIPSKKEIPAKNLKKGKKNFDKMLGIFFHSEKIDKKNSTQISKKLKNHFRKGDKCYGQKAYLSIIDQKKIVKTVEFDGEAFVGVKKNFIDLVESDITKARLLRALKLI